jgi:hypothetical protein
MVRFLWLAVLLFTMAQPYPAHADWTDAVTALSNLCNHLLTIYDNTKRAGDEKLIQQKKDALASINTALIHMSTLKKQMAKNVRCLGENAGSTESGAHQKFIQCADDLSVENVELKNRVSELKHNIDLIDPQWAQNHGDEIRKIDDLYYQKVGVENRTLLFLRLSDRGASHSVQIVANECEKLSNDLDAEAEHLDTAEERFAQPLKGN